MKSKLQYFVSQQLSIHFGQYNIKENHRPDWLNTGNGGNLELDFFIKELNLAIEVQGEQHWNFVPFFHGDKDGYNRQIEYDKQKKRVCKSKAIRLIEIFSENEVLDLISEYIISRENSVEAITENHNRREQIKKNENRMEFEKLRRDLKKIEYSIEKIKRKMQNDTNFKNGETKLKYAYNRKDNIISRLVDIKPIFW